MIADSSGSYDAAIYSCIGIYTVAIVLYTAVPVYQKLLAKERYLMADFKANQRKLKEEEKLELEKQRTSNRTFSIPSSNKPSNVYYERVTTV